MTKQEIIQKAYDDIGYGYLFSMADDNGYIRVKPTQYQNENFDRLRFNSHQHSIRPKSLSGIETNNGWIKISSEDDLPKGYYQDTEYFIIDFDGIEYTAVHYVGSGTWVKGEAFFEPTHYQPIEKPESPIY